MKKSNLVFWVLLMGCLLAGFLSGWTIKDCGYKNKDIVYTGSSVVRIHDTMKVPLVEYRIIPGTEYNVDSLIEMVNQFWKDSLKELYGKGLFEARFVKADKVGKREIMLESRIPVDPEAKVTLTEELKLPEIYPKRSFGIIGGVGYAIKNYITGTLGLKYYVMDYKYFSISTSAGGRYSIAGKTWSTVGGIEAEVRF